MQLNLKQGLSCPHLVKASVLADISQFSYTNAVEFTYHLIQDIGVAVVPDSSFFSQCELGRSLIRFCLSKTPKTLEAAREKLLKLKE